MRFLCHPECLAYKALVRFAFAMAAVRKQIIEFPLDQVFLRFGQDTHGQWRFERVKLIKNDEESIP
jgi:hypothetical protein